MKLTRLLLSNFRNLAHFEVDVEDTTKVVAVVGPNGVGKTSVLEALSMLTGGRGLLGSDAKAQVREGEKGWGLYGECVNGRTVGMVYQGGKRTVKLDGVDARVEALTGVGSILALAPEMDRMFFEAPRDRRAVLDDWAAQAVAGHAEAVDRYLHHTRARLRILLNDGAGDWLEAEEQQAAAWGLKLLEGRQAYFDALGGFTEGVALSLAGGALAVLEDADPLAALKGKLERSRDIDTRLERTNAGPNTLDVRAQLEMNGRQVEAKLASSGQHKRVMVRWLVAQARLVAAKQGQAPLVLIDELSAHLDTAGQGEVLAALTGLGAQAWVSDTQTPSGEGVVVVGLG